MVFLQELGGLQVSCGFPGIVALRIPSPLDQILQLFLLPMMSVAFDGLDLVLFFASYQVQGWPQVVLAMFYCFDIWGKERGVEYGVYGPLRGEC